MFSYKDVLAVLEKGKTYKVGEAEQIIWKHKGEVVGRVNVKLFQIFVRDLLTRRPTFSRDSTYSKHRVLYYKWKLKEEGDSLFTNGFQTFDEYIGSTPKFNPIYKLSEKKKVVKQ